MRLTVYLTALESEALFKMSATEMRLPKDQIRLILRQEMERRGMLEKDEVKTPQKMAAGVDSK